MTLFNLNVIAAILALVIYVVIARRQLRGKKMGLNFATYLLWCVLDVIAATSLYLKGGEWMLPAAYALGCVIVMVPLVITRAFKWTRLDTITTAAVIISVVIWYFVGPTWATIISTIGVVIACVPQAWQVYRKPKEAVIWVFAGYVVVNSLSTIAAKDWSIGEIFYPGCCTVATILILLLSLRKFAKVPAVA